MLALIAGMGELPPALVARMVEKPLICALEGFDPSLPPDLSFRLEHLGTFLNDLVGRGVTQICMAGAVRRPVIDPSQIDAATVPLIPKVQAAMMQGDDGALRIIIALLEEAGFAIVSAHEIAPDLLPPAGVPTRVRPEDWHRADAAEGEACVARMGAKDSGQACIVRAGRVLAQEGPGGTDAMLAGVLEPSNPTMADDPLQFVMDLGAGVANAVSDLLSGQEGASATADDGILFKAPKPAQDRRADLPLIGPGTAMAAAEAGLSGIVIEAGGVMVLDQKGAIDILDAQGMFLWVREKGQL